MSEEKKFLRFEEIKTNGVTKKFKVYSTHSGDLLGVIRWEGGWRHYIMDYGNIIMSLSCNKQLNEFMEILENERK